MRGVLLFYRRMGIKMLVRVRRLLWVFVRCVKRGRVLFVHNSYPQTIGQTTHLPAALPAALPKPTLIPITHPVVDSNPVLFVVPWDFGTSV